MSRATASRMDGLRTGKRAGRQATLLCAAALFAAAACTPTVKVEAPQEPITINLNIKLDADVRVRLEEQAREDIRENEDIF